MQLLRDATGSALDLAIREGLVPLADEGPGGCPPGPHRYRLCCAGVSGFAECYGLSLMVMTTVTFRTAGTDPSERRPSTGTMAVRTSPTLWMVTIDVPSEKRGIVFDLRTMVRLSWTACSTVWGVEASRMLSLIHISEPTRLGMISYAVFC